MHGRCLMSREFDRDRPMYRGCNPGIIMSWREMFVVQQGAA